MNTIFDEIKELEKRIQILSDTKARVIKLIKEKIYANTLYKHYDEAISSVQKAKACIYLYNRITCEGWSEHYDYPKQAKSYRSRDTDNNSPKYLDYFTTDVANVNQWSGSWYCNCIFELPFIKQVFNPEDITKDTWIKLVKDDKTLLGYKEFIESMKIADNSKYLDTIGKYLNYKLIKIDCPELELGNWFYAIHRSNL